MDRNFWDQFYTRYFLPTAGLVAQIYYGHRSAVMQEAQFAFQQQAHAEQFGFQKTAHTQQMEQHKNLAIAQAQLQTDLHTSQEMHANKIRLHDLLLQSVRLKLPLLRTYDENQAIQNAISDLNLKIAPKSFFDTLIDKTVPSWSTYGKCALDFSVFSKETDTFVHDAEFYTQRNNALIQQFNKTTSSGTV